MDFLIKRTRPLTDAERQKVADNQGLIGDVIKRQFKGYIGKSGAGDLPVTYNDLFEAGVFGLFEAVDRWDPERGAFSTCAEWWIKNKIFRWLREFGFLIHIPKWVLQAKGLDQESIEKALAEGKITLDEAKKRQRDRKRLERARAFKPVNEALDHSAEDNSPTRARHRKALVRLIYSIRTETEDEAFGRVIMLKLGGLDGGTPALAKKDEAFEDIAVAMGVTAQRVRRLYEAFLTKLQAFVQDRGIDCPLDHKPD